MTLMDRKTVVKYHAVQFVVDFPRIDQASAQGLRQNYLFTESDPV